jgi:hypothetical protein
MVVGCQWALEWLGRYTMAWGLGGMIKQTLSVQQQRREKHTKWAFVMLCYVRELGRFTHREKVYSRGVTDGKREHNT